MASTPDLFVWIFVSARNSVLVVVADPWRTESKGGWCKHRCASIVGTRHRTRACILMLSWKSFGEYFDLHLGTDNYCVQIARSTSVMRSARTVAQVYKSTLMICRVGFNRQASRPTKNGSRKQSDSTKQATVLQ
jgi:hypothetical protein